MPLPASRYGTGLWPLQPWLLRPPAREGLPEVSGVRLRVPFPWVCLQDGRSPREPPEGGLA